MSPEVTYLLQSLGTVVVFGGVGALALAGLRRIGVTPTRGPLQVVARVPLEGRRAIYLVRVGKERVLVVGAGDAGLSRLATLRMDELEEPLEGGAREPLASPARRSFAQALGKVLRPLRDDSKSDG